MSHCDRVKKCFTSLAFKPSSSDGLISLFDRDCAIRTNGTVCNHIKAIHSKLSGEPPIFWEFSPEILPEGVEVLSSGNPDDPCHSHVSGLDDKASRRLFKTIQLSEFQVCENGTSRHVTADDFSSF